MRSSLDVGYSSCPCCLLCQTKGAQADLLSLSSKHLRQLLPNLPLASVWHTGPFIMVFPSVAHRSGPYPLQIQGVQANLLSCTTWYPCHLLHSLPAEMTDAEFWCQTHGVQANLLIRTTWIMSVFAQPARSNERHRWCAGQAPESH